MNIRRVGLIGLLTGVWAWPAAAADHCTLESFAELPVTMEGLRPIVVAQIDGGDARFIADSGAFWSTLTPAAAAEFKLPIEPIRGPTTGSRLGFGAPPIYFSGVGGRYTASIATAQTFTLARYTLHRVQFLVGGTDVGGGAVVGLLGQNLIRVADVEYDLAHGVIRLIKPVGCARRALAYWATPSDQIGVVTIDEPTPLRPSPIGSAFVNGVKLRVDFDTGTPMSMLSLQAARRAGITPDTPGVQPAGATFGLGPNATKVWSAPVTSFAIGGNEEIKNTRLLMTDFKLGDIDLLLGDDFFLSHRIYIAYGQSKLYFTYGGGAVFKLGSTPVIQSAQQPAAPGTALPAGTASPAGSAAALGQFADQPADAAGFMRRGTAYAARKDFEDALADLRRACELAPQQPDYFFELGRIESQVGQHDQAIDSLSKALRLEPDDVAALLLRAQLTHSKDDLNTVDRLLSPADSLRLQVAALYTQDGAPDAAIHQYDLWIRSHPDDARLPDVLNAGCWIRAESNRDLEQALKDCNAALSLRPRNPAFLDSRGLVQLRRGDLDRAIRDYDAALALRPRMPTSLYGRGLAKLRKGLQSAGQADLTAATAVQPQVAARFARMGLVP